MVGHRLKTILKASALEDRLQYEPEIIEFFLDEQSLIDIEALRRKIRFLKEKGIKVYLHHPSKRNGQYLDILSTDRDMKDYYSWSSRVLASLCREEEVRCVIHCHYDHSECSGPVTLENTLRMRKEIESILEFGRDVFLWEDTHHGLFAHTNPFLMDYVIKPLALDLNLDISHSYIAVKGDNKKLYDIVRTTAPYVKYLHIVDSLGQSHDGLELGQGTIQWPAILPYFKNKDFIFEILLKDVNDCSSMIRSADYYNALDGLGRTPF